MCGCQAGPLPSIHTRGPRALPHCLASAGLGALHGSGCLPLALKPGPLLHLRLECWHFRPAAFSSFSFFLEDTESRGLGGEVGVPVCDCPLQCLWKSSCRCCDWGACDSLLHMCMPLTGICLFRPPKHTGSSARTPLSSGLCNQPAARTPWRRGRVPL